MHARDTKLADALRQEDARHRVAFRVTRDVLLTSPCATDDVRIAALLLLAWLATPAEMIAKR